jgi:hypothetical protein
VATTHGQDDEPGGRCPADDVGMKVGELRAEALTLGFTPQDEVRWLSPLELARTTVKVAVSTLLADYTDRREVQAALPDGLVEIPDPGPEGLWLDFVADLGDGFDPTHSVAWLLVPAARLERLGRDRRLGAGCLPHRRSGRLLRARRVPRVRTEP